MKAGPKKAQIAIKEHEYLHSVDGHRMVPLQVKRQL